MMGLGTKYGSFGCLLGFGFAFSSREAGREIFPKTHQTEATVFLLDKSRETSEFSVVLDNNIDDASKHSPNII